MTKSIGNYLSPVSPSSDRVRTNQVIITPDGIELASDLYIPWGDPPFPAVIEITPYGSQSLSRLGDIYATRGFLFLAVDSRGRYRSSGVWSPLTHDQADGHAVIRWMAHHELCNGRVGTRGHSYSGYNQLLAAIDAPSELQAMVVGVAPGDPFENVPFQGGAYDLNDLFWLLSMTDRICTDAVDEEFDAGEARLNGENQRGDASSSIVNLQNGTLQHSREENREENQGDKERREDKESLKDKKNQEDAECDLLFDQALLARPFRDIDLRFGIRQETFREWINHWQFDDFWEARSVGRRLNRTAVPTLHISGWWDGNGRGSTAFYKGMRERAATAPAREAQRLLLGAWNHDLNAPDCNDLPEEDAMMIYRAACRNSLNDELAWFDKHLMDINPGPSTKSRVTLYLTGIYRWMDFEDWPPPNTQPVDYYLAGVGEGIEEGDETGAGKRGKAGKKFGSLRLAISSEGPEESTYLFNPEDPTPFASPDVDGEKIPFDNAALEKLAVEEERSDILIFDTSVMEEPLALIGELSLILYSYADAPDFDLCAKLLDVYPDGRAIYLTDGLIRARFRKGWDKPELAAPLEAAAYSIDLWHIGHIVRPGHTLRLEVSSAAFLRFDINPCTGGCLADETNSRPARVTILHSSSHPSRLVLPVHNPLPCHRDSLLRLSPGERGQQGAPVAGEWFSFGRDLRLGEEK